MEPLEEGERNAWSPLRPDFVRQTVIWISVSILQSRGVFGIFGAKR